MIPEQYKVSGKITTEVKALVPAEVRPGASFLEVCDVV